MLTAFALLCFWFGVYLLDNLDYFRQHLMHLNNLDKYLVLLIL
ncbi:hypothetical protein COLO4_33429 [Corchorus olitorius]|uniref:Uncharacterized protein n=1 Tax=Corchorus olitorius TaxID=93759 RepID=A0A1R3GTS7_9ROSI|nr:hypothetical protein COLO4_33429 [Corchorus olitorius]